MYYMYMCHMNRLICCACCQRAIHRNCSHSIAPKHLGEFVDSAFGHLVHNLVDTICDAQNLRLVNATCAININDQTRQSTKINKIVNTIKQHMNANSRSNVGTYAIRRTPEQEH